MATKEKTDKIIFKRASVLEFEIKKLNKTLLK